MEIAQTLEYLRHDPLAFGSAEPDSNIDVLTQVGVTFLKE